jgi:hypothetical protein
VAINCNLTFSTTLTKANTGGCFSIKYVANMKKLPLQTQTLDNVTNKFLQKKSSLIKSTLKFSNLKSGKELVIKFPQMIRCIKFPIKKAVTKISEKKLTKYLRDI